MAADTGEARKQMGAHQDRSGLTRRDLFRAGAGLAMGGALAQARGPRTAQARTPANGKPNILFIMDDQHRGDCIGADGNPHIYTPNLDALARDGALFRSAYSSTPTCKPARAALLTGMNPWNHGLLGYARLAPEYPVEMPRLLREAGYYTYSIGKLHWRPQRLQRGFHRTVLDESGREYSDGFRSDYRSWFWSVAPTRDPDATGIGWNSYRAGPYALPEELHPTVWTADVAVNFLREYDRTEPFFLKVSFARPHSPYDPPKRLWDRYEDAELPPAHIGDWADRYEQRSGGDDTIWHGDLGPEQVRRSRQGYYGAVTHIDEQIGRIVETLDERGMLENTLIIFLSDHGDMTGDHHMWRKSYAYEASARVPMILRWPEGLVSGERGQVLRQPVELRDVLPTFLDAAGVSEDRCDGRSLLDLVPDEKPDDWRPWIDLEHDICYDQRNHWSTLTDGRWKYIYHAFDGEEQLFDMESDPGEERDLAGEAVHSETLRTWRGRLVAFLEHRGEEWVKNGELVPRPQSVLYSPNFPES